jgi:hypothetical protein
MRMLLIGLTLAAGCVGMRPAEAPVIVDAAPMDCGKMIPATAMEHAIVHAAPDNNSETIITLAARTPVCVSRRSRGFGLLAVRLPNGQSGFMNTDSLQGLVIDSPPVLPWGLE